MNDIQQKKLHDYIREHDEEMCLEDASIELGIAKVTLSEILRGYGYRTVDYEGTFI